MKKTMIIALLAVLVLGVFTACNGDVNAELMGKRVIKLVMSDEAIGNGFTFEDGGDSLELEIPSDCKTWKDLADAQLSIDVIKNNSDSIKLFVKDGEDIPYSPGPEDGKAHFAEYHNGHWYDCFGLKPVTSKATYYYKSYVGITDAILIGGTYELTHNPYM